MRRMKLNQFFSKPAVVSRNQPVFELTNSVKEEQLETRINELELQLQTFEGIEIENESLRLALNNGESTLRDVKLEAETVGERLALQEKTVKDLEDIKIEYDQAVQTIKSLTSQVNSFNETLATAQRSSIKQQTELDRLLHNNKELVSSNEELSQRTEQAETNYNSLSKEFNSVQDTVTQLTGSIEDVGTKYLKVEQIYNDTKDEVHYWKTQAGLLADQVDGFQEVEQRLHEWISVLENQNSTEQTRGKGNRKQLADTKKVVKEMGQTIEDLISEQQYLMTVNTKLKVEASKPHYMSMGAIQRAEGFEMPSLGEAINMNKLYLGNGRPTLLKFKSREKQDDNEE